MQLARFFSIHGWARPHTSKSAISGKRRRRMRTVRKSAVAVHLFLTHGFRASYIQPTWKAWMGLPLQQSVTQPVIARYVRLSASPCRLSRAHASGERVHVNVFMQAVSTRSCVGKRCIVSALTRCVANINQDNRRFLRLSSVGSLPLAKNALHCTSLE